VQNAHFSLNEKMNRPNALAVKINVLFKQVVVNSKNTRSCITTGNEVSLTTPIFNGETQLTKNNFMVKTLAVQIALAGVFHLKGKLRCL